MTIQLKRNDTKDTISYTLSNLDGSIVNLTGASVRFVMGTNKTLITNSTATIVDAVTGEVEYQLTDADTLVAGTHKAEFEVTFADGKIKTFPGKGYILVTIQANVDKDMSTYVEDQIALRVSEIELFKTEMTAIMEQASEDAATANSMQSQINTLVINGDSSPAAAQAAVDAKGVDKGNLKQRLDDDYNEVTTQLAQNMQETTKSIKFTKGNRRIKKPLVTWVDDDGHQAIYTKLFPKFDAINKPATICLFRDSAALRPEYISQTSDLVNTHGWEVASHSYEHTPLPTFATYEELDDDLKTSVTFLKEKGFDAKTLVYPNGQNNRTVREVASKYFNCATITSGAINAGVLDTFRLKRQGFGEIYGLATLDEYKAIVDEAVANNGWIIFMSHCGDVADFTSAQESILVQLLDYIISLGVDIVTLNDGYNLVGNSVDIGDKEDSSYFLVDTEGNIESPAMAYKQISKTGIDNTTLISQFPNATVSAAVFNTSDNAGLPLNMGGTLETYNLISNDLAYQNWYPYTRVHRVFRRKWNTVTTNWDSWEELGNVSVENPIAHKYVSTDLITAYPNNKITIFSVNSTDGFSTGNGVVTTYRFYGNGWDLQTFRGTNSVNEKRRYVKSDGTWSDWVDMSTGGSGGSTTSKFTEEAANARDGNALIGTYPSGFSYFYVNATANAGFPASGMVTTYNMGGVGFANQIFRKYNSFDTYVRYVQTDGAWSAWKQIQMMA